jgi:hypothetical protein
MRRLGAVHHPLITIDINPKREPASASQRVFLSRSTLFTVEASKPASARRSRLLESTKRLHVAAHRVRGCLNQMSRVRRGTIPHTLSKRFKVTCTRYSNPQ